MKTTPSIKILANMWEVLPEYQYAVYAMPANKAKGDLAECLMRAITKALEAGSKVVVCASTGNTSASAAAYAARAGLTCGVVIPEGKIALGKLAQALIHGAKVVQIRGNFDEALAVVRQLGEVDGVAVVNSINPFRIEGQKTASFEIIEVLGDAPDVHCLPVGNAGNITAY